MPFTFDFKTSLWTVEAQVSQSIKKLLDFLKYIFWYIDKEYSTRDKWVCKKEDKWKAAVQKINLVFVGGWNMKNL